MYTNTLNNIYKYTTTTYTVLICTLHVYLYTLTLYSITGAGYNLRPIENKFTV